jgi:hypothetical protein
MRLNAILLCLLPVVMAAPSLAQTVTISAGDNVVTDWSSVQAGDTVVFASGTFAVSQQLKVPSGVTITSASLGTAHIFFTLAGTNGSAYGFVLAANAGSVEFSNLDMYSTNGLIQMSAGGTYNNITIFNNQLQYGGGKLSDGSAIYGISATNPSTNLVVEHNYFHDSPGSVRNWCIFNTANSYFDYNLFYNINDGGQQVDPDGYVDFSYNYGRYIHRMGQEVALDAAASYNCQYNTFYDYVLPYNDTEGVSIVLASQKVVIANNFFEASIAPGSTYGAQSGAAAGGPQRFGYAIEATGNPGYVYGNTLVGPWAEDVSSDIANLQVYSNIVYGTALWGDFEGEPGPFGYGSIDLNPSEPNHVDNNVNDAPAPPTNVWNAGPNGGPITFSAGSGTTGSTSSGSSGSSSGTGSTASGGGSTTGGTTTGGTPTAPPAPLPNANNPPLPLNGVVVNVQSSTSCTVSWNAPSANITSVTINIISTIGRQNFEPVTGSPTSTTQSISGMHPGWLIDFTVTVVDSSGQTYTSKPVTASFPGNSLAPWQGTLWGGISTQQSNPFGTQTTSGYQ